MGLQNQKYLTPAEGAIVENFKQIASSLPGGESVLKQRERALKQFESSGLPSRRIESWHYTDLKTLLKTVEQYGQDTKKETLLPLLAQTPVFEINNGKAGTVPQLLFGKAQSLAQALDGDGFTLPLPVEPNDFIGQLNTSFSGDGWLIDINANLEKEPIIELQNIQNSGQSHSFNRVNVGQNSGIWIIERQTGTNESAFVSSVSSLEIADNSEVNWVLIRDRGFDATQFSKFSAVLEKQSKLNLYIINLSSVLSRQEIEVELRGRESDFQLRVINLLGGKSHTDITMTVKHVDEASTSTEIIRNVVSDHARGAFQGMIRVAQAAQKTDARMACNSLILSDEAEFDAKPELEIFADDVACGHGATVTEIDHDHLFYLKARGIPDALARGLLVRAFVSEQLYEIENEELRHILNNYVDTWLHTHI